MSAPCTNRHAPAQSCAPRPCALGALHLQAAGSSGNLHRHRHRRHRRHRRRRYTGNSRSASAGSLMSRAACTRARGGVRGTRVLLRRTRRRQARERIAYVSSSTAKRSSRFATSPPTRRHPRRRRRARSAARDARHVADAGRCHRRQQPGGGADHPRPAQGADRVPDDHRRPRADRPVHRRRSPDHPRGLHDLAEGLLEAAGRLFHEPSSGATLLDTIADVSKGLVKREVRSRRHRRGHGREHRVQQPALREVLERLRESGAMLYAVVLVNPNGSMSHRRSAQPRHRARSRAARVRRHAHRRADEHVVRVAAESARARS